MKIYFNRRPVSGPWGGGSKILSKIVTEARRRSHSVFFEEELEISIPLQILGFVFLGLFGQHFNHSFGQDVFELGNEC
jgi:hypothetical protein